MFNVASNPLAKDNSQPAIKDKHSLVGGPRVLLTPDFSEPRPTTISSPLIAHSQASCGLPGEDPIFQTGLHFPIPITQNLPPSGTPPIAMFVTDCPSLHSLTR